jgi:predicted PurR-regulated permease PerM
MSNDKDPSNDRAFLNRGIDLAIRLAVLAVIVFSCFRIFKPFLMPVVWAVIIAIAVYPLFLMLKRLVGGRNRLAGTIFIVVSLAIVLVPTWMLTESLIDGTFASAGSCRKART